MLHIAIVEDEKSTYEEIHDFIKIYSKENEKSLNVKIFQDGTDILHEYEAVWDIIFMDIKMKHLDGMSAAKQIREIDEKVQIIFITSMANYAIKGYEVAALDFLLKPIDYEQFSLKLKKAINIVSKNVKKKYLLVPFEGNKERISTDDILYIEVNGHNLNVVCTSKNYALRSTISNMQEELQEFQFSRCNNSYLVNLKKVSSLEKDIVIIGNYNIPISRPKKKQFLKEFSDYILGSY